MFELRSTSYDLSKPLAAMAYMLGAVTGCNNAPEDLR